MAGATGLEPATYGVTGRHSNQLSYAPAGAREEIRRGAGELSDRRGQVKQSPAVFTWQAGRGESCGATEVGGR